MIEDGGRCMKDRFLLTNEQRKYVGLEPIKEHWEAMDLKGTLYFFDGDIIRKEITSIGYGEDSFYYEERELFVQTSNHRTMVVAETAKGKLNNPYNQSDKNRIFQVFGLRGDVTYKENWKLHKATE